MISWPAVASIISRLTGRDIAEVMLDLQLAGDVYLGRLAAATGAGDLEFLRNLGALDAEVVQVRAGVATREERSSISPKHAIVLAAHLRAPSAWYAQIKGETPKDYIAYAFMAIERVIREGKPHRE